MLRVVLDTNVVVSGLLAPQGTPAVALDAWRERRYLLLTSPALVRELRRTLSYPKIRDKYPITDPDVERLIGTLESDALMVAGDADVGGTVPDDPADEIVLACALDGGATLIVSGDRHLLALGAFRGIEVIPVRQLLDRLPSAAG
ncbi:MAG: putative toxin-antitoxin system toxin component, PIN family [Longimicrobiaceae bacterium]